MDNRRTFLKMLGAGIAAAAEMGTLPVFGEMVPKTGGVPISGTTIRKSVLISMLPKTATTYAERFAIARAAGFDAIEMRTITRDEEAAEINEAAKKAGITIHSVMNEDHWRYPLSSSDREVVDRSVKGMETSLRNAKLWGADTVLLVPAVVDAKTGYQDAWARSQRVIRERILPVARDVKVVVGIEEVWNKFLLSPLEMNRYVDEFQSPWVRAYFDVGNILIWAFPQDWIRTLGSRIVKVHLKDFTFDRKTSSYAFKNIGEGDIDWPEVRKALADVKYTGYVTTEVSGGDEAYLKDVAQRVDRFLAGERPVGVRS